MRKITQYQNERVKSACLSCLFNAGFSQRIWTATAHTHFLFKGYFYDKVDGVSRGSPLAPVLANLFMGHNENAWLENYKDSRILFYRRYVDDTFCVFETEQNAVSFYNYINSQHPNICFTMEKEVDHKLASPAQMSQFITILLISRFQFSVRKRSQDSLRTILVLLHSLTKLAL